MRGGGPTPRAPGARPAPPGLLIAQRARGLARKLAVWLAEYQGMPLMPKPFSGPALTQAVRDVLDERPAAEHVPPV